MGEMKIDIKLDARPIKKRPYKLTHKYKETVKKEIDNMLVAKDDISNRPIGMGNPYGHPTEKSPPDKIRNLC